MTQMQTSYCRKFTYRDFLPIQDYIEALYRDEWLMRERHNEIKLDKIRDLFYELKVRYDIVYAYDYRMLYKGIEDNMIHNDFHQVLDLFLMEYCRNILNKIRAILTTLKLDIGWAIETLFFEFFGYIIRIESRAKSIEIKLRKSNLN